MPYLSSLHPVTRYTAIASTLISVVIALQGCNGGPEPVAAPQFSADPAAFEYAVKKTTELQLFVSECAKVNDELKAKATAAQSSWQSRNWPQAEAADKYYSQNLENDSIVYNGEKISLAAVNLHAEIEKSIALKLDQTRHSRKNITDTCATKLAAYEAGQLDLTENKNADLYLKSLASPTPGDMHKVPSLAGSLKLSPVPGRSQYNLEKTLAEWDCAGARILTLRNEWPYESYGAFCSNGKSIFVSCEWSDCKAQR